ncbi:hypothetical protein ACQY0O_003816 [Thecaphora frezii]
MTAESPPSFVSLSTSPPTPEPIIPNDAPTIGAGGRALTKPTWSDAEVKSLSHLRARQDLRRNRDVDRLQAIQDRLRKHPQFPLPHLEAERQRQIYKAWIQDQEGSPADIDVVNEHIDNPADACPPWDFIWTNGYVHGDEILPGNPDDLTGCDCDEDSCDPRTCTCFQKALRYDTIKIYREMNQFAYNADGTLHDRMVPTYPIFECNSKCGCSKTCRNRVVQKGRRVEIELFKHKDYGWGVRALKPIKRHTFIGAYTGELVNDEESDRRATIYESIGSTYHFTLDMYVQRLEVMRQRLEATLEGRGMTEDEKMQTCEEWLQLVDTYQADRDHNDAAKVLEEMDAAESAREREQGTWNAQTERRRQEELQRWHQEYLDDPKALPNLSADEQRLAKELEELWESTRSNNELTVDGALHGNYTRFFNHSCDPNLALWPVWIEEGSIWRPFHCFFAIRTIDAGEELTFKYSEDIVEDAVSKRVRGYQMQGKPQGTKMMVCKCGAKTCRGYVFS